jgi:Icc-related predicted phosphoesterase
VKILAVSDVELPQLKNLDYLRQTFAEVELLVSCGDMSADYLDLLGSALCLPLFFVRGNHDTRYQPHHPGGDNLHMQIKTCGDHSFAGLEGSICYNNGPIQYTQSEMFLNVLRLMPRLLLMQSMRGYSVDVMVTHSPPWGIHDLSDDFAHRGFRAFRYLMQWAHPRFLIHGHVDTWDRRKATKTEFARTTVININPYKVLTLDQAAAVSTH